MADGSVVFATEIDERGILEGLGKLDNSINSWGKAIVGTKAFSMISDALLQITKAGISYNAEMESYQTNFGVLLGNEADALQHVAQLREMAAKTPFGMSDLASASQTMLSFGLSAEDTMDSLQRLGDIAMGDANKMSSLTLAFSQISSAGKLTGQDLNQMINAGFNPLSTIAEKTGVTIGDLKDVMSGGKGSKEFQKQMKAAQKEVKKMGDQASEGAKWLAQIGTDGAISAEMVGKAMEAETSPGGRFYNGMEQASQTLSGLWSTLQDDTSELLGHVTEPLANGLKNIVLPAALSVVGALNDLLDGDNTVTVSAETQAAIDNVNALDTDIADLKRKYIDETVKIRLDYENANDLIDQLEEAQKRLEGTPKKLWSEEDKATLQSITSQIVSIYPELQNYVGNDGILKLEAEAVRNLTTEYRNLALEKAAAQYKSDAELRVEEAKINQAALENDLDGLQQQKTAATEAKEAWEDLGEASAKAYGDFALSPMGMPENLDTASMESYLSLVERYIELAGGTEGLAEGSEIRGLIGADGEVMSASEVLADADALAALANSLTEIDALSQTSANTQATIISGLDEQIASVETAVAAAKENVNAAVAELERLEAALARVESEEAASATTAIDQVTEAGTTLGNSTFVPTIKADDQASSKTDKVKRKLDKLNGKTITAYINLALLGGAKSLVDGSHADGLSYVPYDNYLAYLHKGEMVLTASEAAALRSIMNGDVASKMAGRSASGMGATAAISARASSQPVNQTNNFYVPVQTPDEFAQTMRIYNTYGLAAQG